MEGREKARLMLRRGWQEQKGWGVAIRDGVDKEVIVKINGEN